jgi:hypothetical protein
MWYSSYSINSCKVKACIEFGFTIECFELDSRLIFPVAFHTECKDKFEYTVTSMFSPFLLTTDVSEHVKIISHEFAEVKRACP